MDAMGGKRKAVEEEDIDAFIIRDPRRELRFIASLRHP